MYATLHPKYRGSFDYLIVGAGFAGSVVAERLAAAGRRVLIIDRRPHIGGSAYDEYDRHGVLIHRYGPHIFHTNSRRILEYLSAFTQWRFYEHRGRGVIDGVSDPIPINRDTINALYRLELDEDGLKAFFERAREQRASIQSSEDYVLSTVGRDLTTQHPNQQAVARVLCVEGRRSARRRDRRLSLS